jgi:hypothetical protein
MELNVHSTMHLYDVVFEHNLYCVVPLAIFIFLHSAHIMCICILCGSGNKQRLFPYIALTERFLQPKRSVFSARYELNVGLKFGLIVCIQRVN